MAKALSLDEKLAGARSFFNLGTITTIGFIRSNYGDEAVKKLFAALAKPLTEQLKKTLGEER